MASGLKDFHTYSDVDIISQSLDNIINKPNWPNYSVITTVSTVLAAQSEVLLNLSGIGEIQGGEINCYSSIMDWNNTTIGIIIDGDFMGAVDFSLINDVYNQNKEAPIYLTYKSLEVAEINVACRRATFFNSSIYLYIFNNSTATISFVSNIRVGTT